MWWENISDSIEIGAETAAKYILNFREIVGGFLGPNLYIFQLISLVISGALLWGIIYTVSRSGWVNKRVEDWMDYLGVGSVGKRRQLKAWVQIVKRMKTNNLGNWKVAILEADKILDDILKGGGYRADTTDGRYKQLTPDSLSSAAEVQEAHRFRNRVAQEPDFAFTKDEAVTILKAYKKALREFGVLD